jgi:hypothetical protein
MRVTAAASTTTAARARGKVHREVPELDPGADDEEAEMVVEAEAAVVVDDDEGRWPDEVAVDDESEDVEEEEAAEVVPDVVEGPLEVTDVLDELVVWVCDVTIGRP